MRQKMPRRGTLRNGTDRILQHFHIFVWTDSLGLSRLSALLVITALQHLMSILLALNLGAIFLTIPTLQKIASRHAGKRPGSMVASSVSREPFRPEDFCQAENN